MSLSREDVVKSISINLSTFSYRLKNENASGMNSLNKILEDILLPILNVIYGASDLQNANVSSANTKSIDLFSSLSRLGVQVTTEASSAKVNKTIISFINNSISSEIDRLIIVLFVAEPVRFTKSIKKNWQDLASTSLTFEASNDVVNGIPHLMRIICSLPEEKLRKIESLLKLSVSLKDSTGCGNGIDRKTKDYFLSQVPQNSNVFSGRQNEIREVKELLASFSPTNTCKNISLQGVAGIGKSQIASRIALECSPNFDIVLWIESQSPDVFELKLAAHAHELISTLPNGIDQPARLRLVYEFLEANENWLLVIDNMEDPEGWRDVLTRCRKGRCIFTTQELMPADIAHCINVDVMQEADGALLLLRRANLVAPEATEAQIETLLLQEALAVSNRLGGLALALDQAGAYIYECSIAPSEYLSDYEDLHQELHSRYPTKPHPCLQVTLRMAINKLSTLPEYGKYALELLSFCSIISPENTYENYFIWDKRFPVENWLENIDWFSDGMKKFTVSQASFRPICAAAIRFSLLRRSGDPASLRTHRLVAEHIEDELGSDGRTEWHFKALCVMLQSFRFNVSTKEFDISQEHWIAAIQLAFRLTDTPRINQYKIRLLDYCSDIAYSNGSYNKNIDILLEIRRVAVLEEANDATRVTISIRLAQSYLNLNLFDKVIDELHVSEGIISSNSLAGTDLHLKFLENKAALMHKMSRDEDAVLALDELLAHIVGRPVKPNTASIIAMIESQRGNKETAKSIYRKAIDANRSDSGYEPGFEMIALLNLGQLHIELKEYGEARACLSKSRRFFEDLHNSHHPQLASVYFWLGRLSWETGQHAEAKQSLRESIRIFEVFQPSNHPDNEITKTLLKVITDKTGWN